MAAGYNLNQELRNLIERNPNFDIRLLLPMMVAQGIIDHHDRAYVQSCHNPIEAANVLFTQIMPVKVSQLVERFFDFLSDQGILNLAVADEFNQFLFYLRENFPDFDVRRLVPELAAQMIISMPEKAIIEYTVTPSDAATILFLQFLPHKGQQLQERFVNVLRQNHMTTLADNLAPLIDRFYAPQQVPDEPAPVSVPQQPQTPPLTVNYPQPTSRQVQPVNPLHAASPFLNVEAIQTLHTAQAYKIEYQALIDALGHEVPDTAGQIEIYIRTMKSEPTDLALNRYYGQNGKRWALLINNYKYDNLPDHLTKNRKGSLVDYGNMTNLLQWLGYEILGKHDRTAQQMMDDVTEFAAEMEKWGDIRSCVVVVMTHGEQGWFIAVDDIRLDPRHFFKVITKNTELAGKPKIFIVQACRGSKINLGMKGPDAIVPAIAEEEADAAAMIKIAAGADTCILHSTTPGYFSWRNSKNGSWFIQAICQEFSAYAHQPWADLLTLCVRVTGQLAEIFPTVPIRNDQGRYDSYDVIQLPTLEVNMKKKFHFFPGQNQGQAQNKYSTKWRPKSNFYEELGKLYEGNRNFDIRFLLPVLHATEIINQNERAFIHSCNDRIQAANVLFTEIMPVKDNQRQQQFITLLHERRLLEQSAWKQFEQFLFYLHQEFPAFDVRYMLPLLTVLSIITMEEQAIIQHSATAPADAACILFLNFMPYKDKGQHERFISLLRQKDFSSLADYLEPKLNQFYTESELL